MSEIISPNQELQNQSSPPIINSQVPANIIVGGNIDNNIPPQKTATNKTLNKKTILLIVAILVLLIGATVSYFLFFKSSYKTSSKPFSINYSGGTALSPISSQLQNNINSGLPPVSPTASISIQNVTIANDQPYDNSSDALSTSNGHYIYHEDTNAFGGAYLGKIIYDGKVVYQNPNTTDPTGSNIVEIENNLDLSQNGLHYGFVLTQNQAYEIYIDGKLVKTIPNVNDYENNLRINGISNDGLHYEYSFWEGGLAFVSRDDLGKTYPFSDDKQPIFFDGNLKNYLTYANNNLIYNGNNVTIKPNLNSYDLSPDGRHYLVSYLDSLYSFTITSSKKNKAYIACNTSNPAPNEPGCGPYQPEAQTSRYIVSGYDTFIGNSSLSVDSGGVINVPQTIIINPFSDEYSTTNKSTVTPSSDLQNSFTHIGSVDGDTNLTYDGISKAGVNNSGDYYFLYKTDHTYFNIDNKYQYTLNTSKFNLADISYVGINDNASHYVIGSDNTTASNWNVDIDGKVSTIPGNIKNIELEGNTLFIYQLAK